MHKVLGSIPSTNTKANKYKSKTKQATTTKANVGENLEKLDLLFIAGGNVKWCSYW
jgi:hypothetical protein